MDKIVLTVLEATLTLYPADASGMPILDSPIWFGAHAERLRLSQTWNVIQTTPTGAAFPVNHPLIPRYEIRIGRIWMLNSAMEDFVPDCGQYVLDISWEEERTGWTKRRTFYGVTIRDRDMQSEGVMEMNDEQVFDAQNCAESNAQGVLATLSRVQPMTVWWSSLGWFMPIFNYDPSSGLFSEIAPGISAGKIALSNNPFSAQFSEASSPAVLIDENGTVRVGGMTNSIPNVLVSPRIDFKIGAVRVFSIDGNGLIYANRFAEGPVIGSPESFVLNGASNPALVLSLSGATFADLEEI